MLTPVFLQGREHRAIPSCSVLGWVLAEGRELSRSMPGWVRSGRSKAATARRRHHMQLMSPLDEGTAVQRGFAFEEALALL